MSTPCYMRGTINHVFQQVMIVIALHHGIDCSKKGSRGEYCIGLQYDLFREFVNSTCAELISRNQKYIFIFCQFSLLKCHRSLKSLLMEDNAMVADDLGIQVTRALAAMLLI